MTNNFNFLITNFNSISNDRILKLSQFILYLKFEILSLKFLQNAS